MLCYFIRTASLARAVAALLMVVILLGAGGCAQAPMTSFQSPQGKDFSALPWTQAFDSLHTKFSREYAFTDWKSIDWNGLKSQFRPAIARAEANNDREAYYIALRGYVHSIPDGHISISPDYTAVLNDKIGGGFGFTLAELDNSQVVVTWVKASGPADAAGIKPGAVILQWDGRPVADAIAQTSILFGPIAPTTERRRYEQVRFVVRAPIGADRTVTFKNPDAASSATATLHAIDDNKESLNRTSQETKMAITGVPTSIIEQKILPGNIGYISIWGEVDLPASFPGDHTPTLTQFRNAINSFIDQKVNGVVIDIRGNSGGSDQMAADFMGSFYSEKTLYEYQTWYNALTNKLEQRFLNETTGEFVPGQGLYIEPQPKQYHGPVVALVDNGCVSSGEGVALGIKNLPNGRVVGFYGTNGSFGMTGGVAQMPGGFLVKWPLGQSLDRNKIIQLDSRNGEGGVMPNVRVPITLDNALRAARGDDVVLEYGLQTLTQMQKSR